MAATLVRKVLLQLSADDGDTEAKLDTISKKADELAEKHPELKVRIDTAAAQAKLAVLRRELKDTGGESVTARERFKSLGAALNTGLLGGIDRNIGEMSTFGKVMAALNLATGLAEPLMAGLIVAVGGLSAGLVSAGLGLGVFGLAAKSAFAQVTAANSAGVKLKGGLGELQTGLKTATGDWDRFGKAASPGIARVMAGALKLIPDALKLAQPFLAPTEKALQSITGMLGKAAGSSGAKSWLGAFAKDSGADLAKLAVAVGHIATGLGGLLKAFLPMSGSMLTGLDKITGKFSQWGRTITGHSGFQSLMSMFKTDTPIVVGLLKNLAGIIKTVVGQMTGMSTVSNSRTLIQVAEAVSGLVNSLLKAHPGLVELALYLKLGADAGKKLHSAITGISDGLDALKTGKKAVSDFAAGFGDAKKAADDATGAAGTYGGKASAALAGVKQMAVQAAQKLGLMKAATVEATEATEAEEGAQVELDGAMDANPIGLIVLAIAGLVIAFAELWKHCAAFRDFWKDAWKDIRKAAADAWHFLDNDVLKPIQKGISALAGFVKSHWKTLATILATVLLGPVGGLVVFIATHWATFKRITGEVVSDVAGFFERLPGRIMSAIASLPGQMFSAGKKIIQSLISGITSMIGGIGHAIGGIAGKIRGFLPFSPAKEGPLSGPGSPDIAGRKIGLMVASGLQGSAAAVGTSAARLARAAQIGGGYGRPGYGAAAAGAAPVKIEIRLVGGDKAFRTWLKKMIRVTGGDVTVVGA